MIFRVFLITLLASYALIGRCAESGQTRFDISTIDGSTYSLEEYLSLPNRVQISSASNIDVLIKSNPEKFLNLLIKGMPYDPERLEEYFCEFFSDIFPDHLILSTLPSFSSSSERLSAILLELDAWAEILNRFRFNIIPPCELWDCNICGNPPADDFTRCHRDLMRQVLKTLSHKVYKQYDSENWWRIDVQFRKNVRNLVSYQVDNDMQFFRFYDHSPESIKIESFAKSYIFLIHHLGAVTLWQSDKWQKIHSDLAKFLAKNMSDEEINKILNSLEIPEDHENILIKSRLNMLRNHLFN